MTHVLTSETLTDIMKKFQPELLKKLSIEIAWKYTGIDGDKTHVKHILKDKRINWNYWQIKDDLNTEQAMKIRGEFFDFLEKVIVDGAIYDFSKQWNKGDCLLINDHYCLHSRDAFLGDRWLKDHVFFAGPESEFFVKKGRY
jgi:hypothetical protein